MSKKHPQSGRRTRRWPSAVVVAGLMAAALAGAGGCNLMLGAMSATEGSQARPAAFTLPAEAATVLFIDDPGNVLPARSLRDLLGERAERELLQQGCVKTAIQSRLLTAQVRRDDLTKPMSVVDLGKSVDAKTVIHVLIMEFGLSVDGQTYSPVVRASVRVVDVPTQTVIFPKNTPWFDLIAAMPVQAGQAPTSSAGVAQAQRDLAVFGGLSVAQLFYDHVESTNPKSLDEARKR